jgi:hypothetical protein
MVHILLVLLSSASTASISAALLIEALALMAPSFSLLALGRIGRFSFNPPHLFDLHTGSLM